MSYICKWNIRITFIEDVKARYKSPLAIKEQECILFCAGKTRVISNCSHLFRSRMLRSCQFRVGVPYFAQVCTTFVVYSVTNSKSNARKNG